MAAIADLFGLFDKKLKDTFHKKEYDPANDRAKMIKRLDSTKEKFGAGEPARGKKDYAISNGVVEWTPMSPHGASLFEDATVYVPSERFYEAVEKTVELVRDGAFDARLKGDDDASAPKAPRAARKPRDPNSPKTEKSGWSDARREAFAATIAARKAAKGQ